MAERKHVMILHGGGLRSLVATAAVLNRPEPARVTLLHAHDGRDAAEARLEHARRQADYYALRHLHELPLNHLFDRPAAHRPDGLPEATLAGAQLLVAALGHAMDAGAAELVWPIAVDGEVNAVASAQERQILCLQLAELGAADAGRYATDVAELSVPLLGYSDRQLIELGAGLGVPWELAWSCVQRGPTQCGSCPACRRRRSAFGAAGVVDAVFDPAKAA